MSVDGEGEGLTANESGLRVGGGWEAGRAGPGSSDDMIMDVAALSTLPALVVAFNTTDPSRDANLCAVLCQLHSTDCSCGPQDSSTALSRPVRKSRNSRYEGMMSKLSHEAEGSDSSSESGVTGASGSSGSGSGSGSGTGGANMGSSDGGDGCGGGGCSRSSSDNSIKSKNDSSSSSSSGYEYGLEPLCLWGKGNDAIPLAQLLGHTAASRPTATHNQHTYTHTPNGHNCDNHNSGPHDNGYEPDCDKRGPVNSVRCPQTHNLAGLPIHPPRHGMRKEGVREEGDDMVRVEGEGGGMWIAV